MPCGLKDVSKEPGAFTSTSAFYPEDGGTRLSETLILTEQTTWHQVTEDHPIILHFTLTLPKLTHSYSRPMDSTVIPRLTSDPANEFFG